MKCKRRNPTRTGNILLWRSRPLRPLPLGSVTSLRHMHYYPLVRYGWGASLQVRPTSFWPRSCCIRVAFPPHPFDAAIRVLIKGRPEVRDPVPREGLAMGSLSRSDQSPFRRCAIHHIVVKVTLLCCPAFFVASVLGNATYRGPMQRVT